MARTLATRAIEGRGHGASSAGVPRARPRAEPRPALGLGAPGKSGPHDRRQRPRFFQFRGARRRMGAAGPVGPEGAPMNGARGAAPDRARSSASRSASRTPARPRCRWSPRSTACGMRAVLGLFEGVCTGAADGYARMAGRPAATLLHLGPGFANGLANLHNARRAGTPVVNWIGDHATWHLAADAPLTLRHRVARAATCRLGAQRRRARRASRGRRRRARRGARSARRASRA